ncbi:MAG: hypothetical protein K2X32_14420 [Phycisphaerales bacterium]|nr:hypothetical protein [Phycisphaerales bacterium]
MQTGGDNLANERCAKCEEPVGPNVANEGSSFVKRSPARLVPARRPAASFTMRLFVAFAPPIALLAAVLQLTLAGMIVLPVVIAVLAVAWPVVAIWMLDAARVNPQRVPLLVAIVRFFGFLG